jgi:hypothetical protein
MKMRARYLLTVLGVLSLEAWWLVRAVAVRMGQ